MSKNIFQKQFEKTVKSYIANRLNSVTLDCLKKITDPDAKNVFAVALNDFKRLLHSYLIEDPTDDDYTIAIHLYEASQEWNNKTRSYIRAWFKSFLSRYDYITFDVCASSLFSDDEKLQIHIYNKRLQNIYNILFS